MLRIKLCNSVSRGRLAFFLSLKLFSLLSSVSSSVSLLPLHPHGPSLALRSRARNPGEDCSDRSAVTSYSTTWGEQATPHHPLGSARPADQLTAPAARATVHYQLATLSRPPTRLSQYPPALATLCPPQPCNIGFQASARDWTSVNPCYVLGYGFPPTV